MAASNDHRSRPVSGARAITLPLGVPTKSRSAKKTAVASKAGGRPPPLAGASDSPVRWVQATCSCATFSGRICASGEYCDASSSGEPSAAARSVAPASTARLEGERMAVEALALDGLGVAFRLVAALIVALVGPPD